MGKIACLLLGHRYVGRLVARLPHVTTKLAVCERCGHGSKEFNEGLHVAMRVISNPDAQFGGFI